MTYFGVDGDKVVQSSSLPLNSSLTSFVYSSHNTWYALPERCIPSLFPKTHIQHIQVTSKQDKSTPRVTHVKYGLSSSPVPPASLMIAPQRSIASTLNSGPLLFAFHSRAKSRTASRYLMEVAGSLIALSFSVIVGGCIGGVVMRMILGTTGYCEEGEVKSLTKVFRISVKVSRGTC